MRADRPTITKFRSKKRLGQNFLVDENVARNIVDSASIENNEIVLEIGPGQGALTGLLLQRAKKVIAIEIDYLLKDQLQTKFGNDPNLQLLNQDILQTDWQQIKSFAGQLPLVIVASLPFAITSPTIYRLLQYNLLIDRALLVVQEEVAKRIVSGPGNKDYGILSVIVQLKSQAESLFKISRHCFRPVPKVDSALLRLNFSRAYDLQPKDEATFIKVVKRAFGQRRKMLRNSLFPRKIGTADVELIETATRVMGVDLSRRPEALDLEGFVRLSDAIFSISAPPT